MLTQTGMMYHTLSRDSHKHSPEHDSNKLGLQDAAYAGPEVPVMCQCGQATTNRMPMQMLMMKKVQMDTTTLCHCVSFRFCRVSTGVGREQFAAAQYLVLGRYRATCEQFNAICNTPQCIYSPNEVILDLPQ